RQNLRPNIAFAIPFEQLNERLCVALCAEHRARCAIADDHALVQTVEMCRMKRKTCLSLFAVIPLDPAKHMIALPGARSPVIANVLPIKKPVFMSNSHIIYCLFANFPEFSGEDILVPDTLLDFVPRPFVVEGHQF